MDKLELAKALLRTNVTRSSSQTTTAYGIAASDSSNGTVTVNLGGDTVSTDDDQTIEVATTFAVKEGDEVILSLVGADGTGKTATVIGVVGRGDEQQAEIDAVTNYFWTDAYGAHVSTEAGSVNGANMLLDADSLEFRVGSSNSESDQTVLASFGQQVTVGSRASGSTVGSYSQVFGNECSATKEYAHAEGYQTQAAGHYSHAEGCETKATHYSHAEGDSTYAYNYSHAEGAHTTAGSHSHAEGNYTIATGGCSHAEGIYSKVTATAGHAEGYGTIVSSCRTGSANGAQHAQGAFNVEDTSGTYCDIIGNGTGSDTYSNNAYNMDWNGNAEFQGEVYVGGCTPNGETPYPVVRYNTSSSQSEYYDSDSSAWTAISGGGGGSSWTSLWTNADPTSTFSAQTVSLDLSGYSVIAIKITANTNYAGTRIEMAMVGDTAILEVSNFGSSTYKYMRQATVSSSGVTFSTGYRNNTGTTGTGYCIPVAIYGVC